MVLAILSFAFQLLLTFYVNVMSNLLGKTLTVNSANTIICIYVACTIISFVTLFTNIKHLKEGSEKGKYITGIVFSGIGVAMGFYFCTTVLVLSLF